MAGKELKVFLNESIDVTSWETILAALQDHPDWSYVAFERDDDGAITAVSYRWDAAAFSYAESEDWDKALQEFQAKKCFVLQDMEQVNRLKPIVAKQGKVWVDQHCIPQVNGKMGCVAVSGQLYHGPVFAAFLTIDKVDEAYANNQAHELLGQLEGWIGRGWVQQEVTAKGKLVNLGAFEHFFQKGIESGDGRLRGGGESLCLLLRRMKGADGEPLADRVVRFYAVMEAEFTVEDDRAINIPDFSDVGYESYPIDKQPDGYVLQPNIQVADNRVYMKDSNGNNIGKWFKRCALYVKS